GVERIDEDIDDLDWDGEVRIQEHDRVARRGLHARANSRALSAVRQAKHLEGETEMPMHQLGAMEHIRGGVRRAVVGEDDLGGHLAVAKELGASPEALLDAT